MPNIPRRRRRDSRPRPHARPWVEGLETRCLMSVALPGVANPGSESPVNDTLDAATNLTTTTPLSAGGGLQVSGVVGDSPAGAADVDWFHFQLAQAANVSVSVGTAGLASPLRGAVSLYNDAPTTHIDPTDNFSPLVDPYTPDGHRLLAQADAGAQGSAAAQVTRVLAAGNYWVAVSGSGNDAFNPFLAGSGLDGSTGAYTLSITATDPGVSTSGGPVVLAADPAAGAALTSSPFLLRFDLSGPGGFTAGTQATPVGTLLESDTNDFTAGHFQTVGLAPAEFEPTANELMLVPNAPLAQGYYRVILPQLGPGGADYALQFHVTGSEGNTAPNAGADDTLTTARNLGNLGDAGNDALVQVSGAIGNDPTYTSFSPSDVDLYKFHVSGTGNYALDAEVFAGRIGSPLNAALSLFKMDPVNGLTFVASNADTQNTSLASNGALEPLYNDPALFVALQGGADYYLAVTADPLVSTGLDPSVATFDPTQTHSSTVDLSSAPPGALTGPYQLDLLVQPAGPAPHVVSAAVDTAPDGGSLTDVRVQFDQPVNLPSLSFQAYQDWLAGVGDSTMPSVTLADATNPGVTYALRMTSYDQAAGVATFAPYDSVPDGHYTLRLTGSGPQGITNLGGVPLAADFVVPITVAGARETTTWQSQPGNDDLAHAQNIGPLFPAELSRGVTISRDTSLGTADHEDDFSVQLLQSRLYYFSLGDGGVASNLQLTVRNAAGAVVWTGTPNTPSLFAPLDPGTYTVQVTWDAIDTSAVGPTPANVYTVHIDLFDAPDNPMPLVVGPGPAVRVRLLTDAADPGQPPAGSSSPPATGGSPPASSGPVTLTVSLPAGLSAPAVTPASASGGFLPLPGAFALTSSPLLVQAFSPLAGVAPAGSAGTPGGAPVLVRAPSDAAPADVARLVVALTSDTGFGDVAPAPPVAASGAGKAAFSPALVERVLDAIFGLWDWFRSTPVPLPAARWIVAPPAPAPADVRPGGDGVRGGAAPALPVTADDGPPGGTSPWLWAGAGALAAAAVLGGEQVRKARLRTGERRPWTVDPQLPTA